MFPEVSQRRGSSYPEPVQPSAYRHFIAAHPESPEVSYAKIFPSAAFRETRRFETTPAASTRLDSAAQSPGLQSFAPIRNGTENSRAERKYRPIARNGTRQPNNGIPRSLPIREARIYRSAHPLNSSRLSLMNHGYVVG